MTLPRAYFASSYLIADYWLFALEVPPAGYEWVRDDGDALLVSIDTGEILAGRVRRVWLMTRTAPGRSVRQLMEFTLFAREDCSTRCAESGARPSFLNEQRMALVQPQAVDGNQRLFCDLVGVPRVAEDIRAQGLKLGVELRIGIAEVRQSACARPGHLGVAAAAVHHLRRLGRAERCDAAGACSIPTRA